MHYLEYFFEIIKDVLNLYDIDMFGLGFTLLELFLAGLLLMLILQFLLHSFNVVDRNNFFSIVGGRRFVVRPMQHDNREKQLTLQDANNFYRTHGYPPSGFIDVWGDGTYIIEDK